MGERVRFAVFMLARRSIFAGVVVLLGREMVARLIAGRR